MNKFKTFSSGNEYCLKDFFCNDMKIVIPDLQRDYCWGDNAYKDKGSKPQELVTGFVNNIIELYKHDAKSPVTLGLIYGYEQPCNHIQICDGQQRLTTLFLLLGAINTKCDGAFSKYIISKEEMADDYEPHLLYAIRESTLYFLSDLSLHLFVNKELGVQGIRSSNWYFQEYNQDASIQSMIAALQTIYELLDSHPEIDYNAFGEYVLNNLRILYYDMENRSRGEETYVVINTTGEPLSATENIKPILLGNLSGEQSECYSCQWEDREEWFWQHRGSDTTGDNGMYTFFQWYWQIGLQQEYKWKGDKKYPLDVKELFVSAPRKKEELDNLHEYFCALKLLVEVIATDEKIQRVLCSCQQGKVDNKLSTETEVWTWLRSADPNIVLPLLHFVKKYGTETLYSFARRIRKNYFDLVWSKDGSNQPSRRGANYVDWRYIIQIISQSDASHILCGDIRNLNIVEIPNVPIYTWYTEDEAWKNTHREELKNLEEMEDHILLRGDLTVLHKGCDGTEYDIDMVCRRWNNLQRICKAFKADSAKEDTDFANWFRLYCVTKRITTIGHIRYCNWGMEGCFFSEMRKTPWWIESKEIDPLLCSDAILAEVKQAVFEEVKNYIRCPQNRKELIISWLTLKTIAATKTGKLLNHRNDRALSAFIDMKKNYIVPCDEFHWGNVLCGYSWSYTIYPAWDENNWQKSENLDSPLSSIPFISNYNDRGENCIKKIEIEKYDGEITQLIECFFEEMNK